MKNEFGIEPLEVYHLFYFGVNVFLCVGGNDGKDYVYVYELETAPTNDGYEKIVYNEINSSFVGKMPEDRICVAYDANNSFFGKALKVFPELDENGEYIIPVLIKENSVLFQKATQNIRGEMPVAGEYKFKKVCDGSPKSIRELLNTKFNHWLLTDSLMAYQA